MRVQPCPIGVKPCHGTLCYDFHIMFELHNTQAGHVQYSLCIACRVHLLLAICLLEECDGMLFGQVVNGTLYFSREVQEFDNGQYIARVWDNFLGPQGFGPVPVKVHLPLGAEFLVRRGRILARPRRFYLDALAFLTEFKKDGVMSGFELAISFERVWHIIFGEEPTAGPALTLCQLYRCPQRQVNNTLLTEIKVKHLHQS